jgi:hypothetical protein
LYTNFSLDSTASAHVLQQDQTRSSLMKTVTVADLQHDVSHYLELAEEEDILLLNNGKPVGFLRGFANDDDLFDYQLESDPRFLSA